MLAATVSIAVGGCAVAPAPIAHTPNVVATPQQGHLVVSGYVFFPKGNYDQVETVLVDRETGATETVREPWH